MDAHQNEQARKREESEDACETDVSYDELEAHIPTRLADARTVQRPGKEELRYAQREPLNGDRPRDGRRAAGRHYGRA